WGNKRRFLSIWPRQRGLFFGAFPEIANLPPMCYKQDINSSGVSPMEKTADERRINELRTEIALHDHLYYDKRPPQPKISNDEYDALFLELKKLEAEYPDLITPDSPTQRVGGK